jgi:DNA-binding NtrC family response regulator
MGRKALSLSAAAMEKLFAWDFPGNVRELENILERAVIFCEGPVIGAGDIDIHMGRFQNPEGDRLSAGTVLGLRPPAEAAGITDRAAGRPADANTAAAGNGSSFSGPDPEKDEPQGEPQRLQTLEDIEKNAILSALERCGGNRTKAAEELGITRKTILNKLKGYS